jgi:hypothetical protein
VPAGTVDLWIWRAYRVSSGKIISFPLQPRVPYASREELAQ